MKKLIIALVASLCATMLFAADVPAPADQSTLATGQSASLDSARMEKDLQNLTWDQFRSVVRSVPKMKADVDAYGPLGWDFVRQNYATHSWKKGIDRLDPAQKQQLADLIQSAKAKK